MQHGFPDDLQEIEEELVTQVLEGFSAEQRQRWLSSEELRRLLPAEERLRGLSPEELVAGLSEEDAARLREILERKQKGH